MKIIDFVKKKQQIIVENEYRNILNFEKIEIFFIFDSFINVFSKQFDFLSLNNE